MKKDGLDNVRAEPVKVPHWVRGQESVEITYPHRSALAMLGLGNSVGTPADGIEAEVLVVRTFAELDAAGAAGVKGKIVLFNVPFTTYGETVQYRARRSIAGGRARRRRHAHPRGRPSRAAHAAHGLAALCRRHAADPSGRDRGRRRRSAAAHAEPGHEGPGPLEDGGEVPA